MVTVKNSTIETALRKLKMWKDMKFKKAIPSRSTRPLKAHSMKTATT
jgi:hypothetical protein